MRDKQIVLFNSVLPVTPETPGIPGMSMDITMLKASEIKKYVLNITASYSFDRPRSSFSDIDTEKYIKEALSRQLASELLEGGYITFKDTVSDYMPGRPHNDVMVAVLPIFDYYKFQVDFEPERLV